MSYLSSSGVDYSIKSNGQVHMFTMPNSPQCLGHANKEHEEGENISSITLDNSGERLGIQLRCAVHSINTTLEFGTPEYNTILPVILLFLPNCLSSSWSKNRLKTPSQNILKSLSYYRYSQP